MFSPDSPFAAGDSFEDQVFADLDLTTADLAEKDFVRCTFRKIHLTESRWQRARLEDCVFDGCDLMRMQPLALALRGVEFLKCRLIGVDWTGIAPNPSVAFEECNLQYASFVKANLTGTAFRRCRAIEVNFIDTRLQQATFDGCDLSGANFDGCDLQKADFSTAIGFFADPVKNRVKGARINAWTAMALATSLGFRAD
jgi:fluoroquinolone resistance protein